MFPITDLKTLRREQEEHYRRQDQLVQSLEPCYYWCDIADTSEVEISEPDWTRIPPERVESVRKKFEAAKLSKAPFSRWKLFGPQIAFYMRQPYYTVNVLSKVDE